LSSGLRKLKDEGNPFKEVMRLEVMWKEHLYIEAIDKKLTCAIDMLEGRVLVKFNNKFTVFTCNFCKTVADSLVFKPSSQPFERTT
jgi:hypothetical protein